MKALLWSLGWLLTFKSLIVMYFSRWSLVLISLQHCQKTLMDTDILLFCLYHPDTLLTHCPYNAKNIYMIRHLNLLEDSVQGNKCARAANTSTVNVTNGDSATLDLHSSGHVSLCPKFQIKVHLPSWTTQIIFYKYANRVLILISTATEDIKKYQYIIHHTMKSPFRVSWGTKGFEYKTEENLKRRKFNMLSLLTWDHGNWKLS